jgi:hypothetical protein
MSRGASGVDISILWIDFVLSRERLRKPTVLDHGLVVLATATSPSSAI